MQNEFVVREACLSDLNAILEIENHCFQSDQFSKRQFAYLISKAKGIFRVVECNKKTVAYISLLFNTRNNNLRIYSIAVHPDHRKQGIAQLLIDNVIDCARSKTIAKLSLEVNINNLQAIRLYEKNGFIISGIKPEYYHDRSDAYCMKRIIN